MEKPSQHSITSKDESKEEKRKLPPLLRFRAIVRRVIHNLSWMTEGQDQIFGTNVELNVRLLKQRRTQTAPVSGLTFQIKTILMKRIPDRTEEDKFMLYKAMKGLKCFKRYPDEVKKMLTAVSGFVVYGPGRVVVRQGQYAYATYFIADGEIIISITNWDPLYEEWITKDVGTMGPGDMFGEVSLLHDVPRTATCTTRNECGFLFLERDHFVAVLKETLMQQWDDCKEALKLFPYFTGLDEVAIRECCILSRIVSYEPKETILGFGRGKYYFTHFILAGDCQVVEELKVVVWKKKGKIYPQHLYSEESPLSETERIEIFYVEAYVIQPGQCFNIGENLKDKAIVCLTPVKCLLCPAHWMRDYNPAKIWDRILHYFARQLPTKEEIYNKFIENRKWITYRKDVTGRLTEQNTSYNPTSINDVPYSIRLYENIYPHMQGYK